MPCDDQQHGGALRRKHLRNTLQGDFAAAGPKSQEVGVDPVPVVRRIVEAGARSVAASKRRPRSRLLWKTTTLSRHGRAL